MAETSATISAVVTSSAAAIATAVAAAAMAAAATVTVAVAAAMAAAVAAMAAAAIASAAAVAAAIAAAAAVVASAARGGGGGGGGMPPQVVGEAKGIVKFFNPQKGFGFITREDGGEDVFVHISAVEQAGLQGLAEGQPLDFTLVDRGGRISATDLKIEGDPLPVEDRGGGGADGGARGGPQRQLTGEKASGTVKFFNATKGFGFITRDDGQPDAFVHISAVERAGMISLNEGDRIEFELEVDRRGKTAAVNLVPIQ